MHVLPVGSDEFFASLEHDRGIKRITVTAHAGDTIEAIGKRFDVSVQTMERINRRGAQRRPAGRRDRRRLRADDDADARRRQRRTDRVERARAQRPAAAAAGAGPAALSAAAR